MLLTQVKDFATFKTKSVVVVTPVYEDLEASSRLFVELHNQFKGDIFIVAVDDGSVKNPLTATLFQQTKPNIAGVILKLRRNVGHQRAIAIGLAYISESLHNRQRVVVMDSDGEDLPSTISTLLEATNNQETDVAVSHRKSRVETLKFKAFYMLYKAFFRLMTGRKISFGNFMALTPQSVKRLVCMHELPIHIAGAVIASKLRITKCAIDRGPRYAGQSKMNFVGLALHGFKALVIFAEDVLVRVGIGSALTAGLTVVGAMTAIVLKSIGMSTPGWFSVALGLMMLMFMQTGTLALMTLMLTGTIRSGAVIDRSSYLNYIDAELIAFTSRVKPKDDSRTRTRTKAKAK